VIRGHRDDHAMLDAKISASSFICARIFCSSGATSKRPAKPSGFIPG
jgi:hypothetical protein